MCNFTKNELKISDQVDGITSKEQRYSTWIQGSHLNCVILISLLDPRMSRSQLFLL
jgi:hypothetical protein